MLAERLWRRLSLRSFDFGIDEMAVKVTRHPEALVSALRKPRDDRSVVAGLTAQTVPLWFEPIPHDEVARPWHDGGAARVVSPGSRWWTLSGLIRTILTT